MPANVDATYIIRRPLLSEKSNRAREASNKYSFMVQRKATKADVKKAVEKLFSVKVEDVTTLVLRGKVKRSYLVRMRYQNEKGEHKEREAFYYLGGCFQHELDHLNGILWVDYQSPMKREFVKKKMLKLKSLQSEL